ncbi:MAG TPA: ATP-binding protein [Tepidisphaeraceae bacterium]|jgi:PAS domain S-box-containing protein|nr:ATP-binding protein [Tepidisphaeraceae bacterium]
MVIERISSRVSPVVAIGVAVLIMAGTILLDIFTPAHFNPTILYVPALVMVALVRSRRVLWAGAIACIFLTLAGVMWGPRPDASLGAEFRFYMTMDRALVILSLAAAAVVAHLWIRSMNVRVQNEKDLQQQNDELAAREEEIARQNEELQSQTEELERQSEELRLTNEELARREHALEALLDLSRSLTAGLSQNETMDRICGALSQLVNRQSVASAILEREGDEVKVRCHYGFGRSGLEKEKWPLNQSFTHLILEANKTGSLEDVSLRPDLIIPQPKVGDPMRSVMAAPLRVRGKPVGSVEVYAHEKQAWTDEQSAIVESLAAQASISLESAALFDEIDAQRRRFETVFRTLPIGVIVANSQYTDVRINPAGAAMFGLPVDANLASPDVIRTWEVRREGKALFSREQYPLLRAMAAGDSVTTEEIEVIATAGRHLVLLAGAAAIRNRDGSIAGAVSAFTDITELKNLQRELEIRRREAEEASVRKTRFLAAVSHDIRTPANAISLMAELVHRTASNPAMASQIPQMATELQSSAATLVELVSDVLDVARFDSGKIELQESEFSLGALFNDEGRQLSPMANEKNLKFDVELPEPPIWLRTDRVKLGRVIANLLGNAIKFTPRGEVRLGSGRMPDGGVRIYVSDTGVGIGPEHRARIFDEFYQLRNPERDRNKGTGLGLAISKRLVDAMGGVLDVESTPGRGSEFSVTLPASVISPRREAVAGLESGIGLAVKTDRPPRPGQNSLRDLKILVIEDHHGTRSATAQILESEGAEVLQAADGKTGLKMLRREQPHILLLDLMLPDIDGKQVLAELRKDRPSQLRLILVLTGDLVSSHEDELKALGVDAVCPKPVDIPVLLSILAAAGMNLRPDTTESTH